MIFGKTKDNYFWTRDWTGQIRLMSLAKFVFWRRLMAAPGTGCSLGAKRTRIGRAAFSVENDPKRPSLI
jgi:hypothetical protein